MLSLICEFQLVGDALLSRVRIQLERPGQFSVDVNQGMNYKRINYTDFSCVLYARRGGNPYVCLIILFPSELMMTTSTSSDNFLCDVNCDAQDAEKADCARLSSSVHSRLLSAADRVNQMVLIYCTWS